jgi:hypothetical protein
MQSYMDRICTYSKKATVSSGIIFLMQFVIVFECISLLECQVWNCIGTFWLVLLYCPMSMLRYY